MNFLKQQKFLKKIEARLDDEVQAQSVIDDMNAVLASLTNLSTTTFHMATNVEKLANRTDIMAPWLKFVENLEESSNATES